MGFPLINKTEKADGSLSTAYMVKVMTNSSIVLKKLSGSTTKETVNSLTTIKFEADKVYNVKFRVETSADSVHIEVYVDNTLYIDYTDTNSPYTGTVFGLRCGAFTNDVVAHKFSLVSINPLS